MFRSALMVAVGLVLACGGLARPACAQQDAGQTYASVQIQAINTSSDSNLKQIGLCFIQYTMDNNDVLPSLSPPAHLIKVLLSYSHDESVFHHPRTKALYLFNPKLSHKPLAEIFAPAETVAAFEPQPAPDGTRGILFVDGRVKRVNETAWPAMRQASGIPSSLDTSHVPWGTLAASAAVGTEGMSAEGQLTAVGRKLISLAPHASVETAVAGACHAKIQRVADAIREYTHYLGRFPGMADAAELQKSLCLGAGATLYQNPLTGQSYLPNPNLSKKAAASVLRGTVLLYDAEPGPDRVRAVVFTDGNEVDVPEQEWPAWQARCHLPDSPTVPASESLSPSLLPAPPSAASVLSALFVQARLQAQEAVSLSNLKQLGLGILQWSQDNDEKYPTLTGPAVFKTQIFPYMKADNFFLDPIWHLPYQTNPKSSDLHLVEIDNPADTILLFEARPTPGYPNTRAALMADGHVKRFPEGVFREMCRLRHIPLPDTPLAGAVETASDNFTPSDPNTPLSTLDVLQKPMDSRSAQDLSADAAAGEKSLSALKSRGGNEARIAEMCASLALTYEGAGNMREAAANFRVAYAFQLAHAGNGPPVDAGLVYQLAIMDLVTGNRVEAEQVLGRELARSEAHAGMGQRADADFTAIETEANCRSALVQLYLQQGRYAEAETQLRRTESSDWIKQMTQLILEDSLAPSGIETYGMMYPMLQSIRMTRLLLMAATGRKRETAQLNREIIAATKLTLHVALLSKLEDGDPAQNNAMIVSYRELFKPMDAYLTSGAQVTPEQTEALLRQLNDFGRQAGGSSLESVDRSFLEFYVSQGRFAEADAAAAPLVSATSQMMGPESPATAAALIDQATAKAGLGQYAEAEPLYRQGLDILLRGGAQENQTYAQGLLRLGALYALTKRPDQAARTFEQAMTEQQTGLRRFFAFSSEPAMRDYLNTAASSLDLLLGYTLEQKADDPPLAANALTWTLRRKGILLDTLVRFRQAQRAQAGDPALAQKVALLRQTRRQIADRATGGGQKPGPGEPNDADLQSRAEALEADIHGRLTGAHAPDLPEMDADAVRRALPPGSALVEFVRIAPFELTQMGSEKGRKPARYVAFVLPAAAGAPVQVFDLDAGDSANENAVESAVAAVRADIQGEGRGTEAVPTRQAETSGEEQYRRDAGGLYRRVFAPLKTALGGATTVYLATDGQLNRVPFEALVDENGKYLVENYHFVYLTSGRDLLAGHPAPATGTVIFGGPDFSLDVAAREQALQSARMPSGAALSSAPAESVGTPARRSRDAGDLVWPPLTGARAEAEDVSQALTTSPYGPVAAPYVGGQALEDVFKTLPAPRILHLATHGFYLPDQSAQEMERSATLAAPVGGSQSEWMRLSLAEDPMLRSGFVLAGADHPGDGSRVEDGWVTAEEVSALDFAGTELVVLSTCNSGLGDVVDGQDVYGLRRAFLYAGARMLVTSLFSVPDQETRALMQRFYARLKSCGNESQALRDAELGVLEERRQAGRSTHPYYWASFILVGNPN